MWHEVFAPSQLCDVTWSLPKLKELHAWLPFRDPAAVQHVTPKGPSRRAKSALAAPPVFAAPPTRFSRPMMLMHGPSGCGKLAVLRVAYRQLLEDATAVDQSSLPSADGQGSSSSTRRVFFSVEHTLDELEAFLSAALRWNGGEGAAADRDALFVVKELPATFDSGRPGNGTFEVLRRFARAVEAAAATGRAVPAVVFIHTVHDTHSTKVDLHRAFPVELIESVRTQQFHCTAATVLSIVSRLRAVVAAAWGAAVAAQLPAEVLESVAGAAHGDVRQALLQLQWQLLGVTERLTPDPPPAPRVVVQPKKPQPRRETDAVGITVINLLDEDIETISDDSRDDDPPAAPAVEPSAAASTATGRMAFPAGSALLVRRDDYIDVAHGAARVLTQKYTVEEVMQKLTVPCDRLMSYVAANMYRYFAPGAGMPELARCAAACSRFDRTVALMHDPSTRTPPSQQYLSADEVAMRCFGAEFKTMKHVIVPRDFVGLSPLPPVAPKLLAFCRRAAPVVDDDDLAMEAFSSTSPRRRCWRGDNMPWRNNVDAVGSRLRAEMFPLITAAGTDDLATDILPLLPHILLELPPADAAPGVQQRQIPPFGGMPAPRAALPKRTMFAAAKPSAPPLRVTDTIVALARNQLPSGRYVGMCTRAGVVVDTVAVTTTASGDADDPITDFTDE